MKYSYVKKGEKLFTIYAIDGEKDFEFVAMASTEETARLLCHLLNQAVEPHFEYRPS